MKTNFLLDEFYKRALLVIDSEGLRFGTLKLSRNGITVDIVVQHGKPFEAIFLKTLQSGGFDITIDKRERFAPAI